jgi:hypothetical protein
MRNIETRINKLEHKIMPRTLPVQILYVPNGLPREDWDKWVADNADVRPLYVFPEGLSLEECIAEHGVVEVSLDEY